MARVIDDPLEPRRRGPAPKYPWAGWLDGQTWLLVPGEDFTISTLSMRTMVYQQAYARGLKVVTELHGPVGQESIKVRAYRPDEETP